MVLGTAGSWVEGWAAYGKGLARHCHSWVGVGCSGYPGRQLPKVTQPLGAGLPQKDLRGSPLFFIVCLPCLCDN